MLRLKENQYLAIINEEKMVEVHADSKERAREIIEKIYDGNICICKIPSIIGYIGGRYERIDCV